jgi:ABC-type phosphate transport system substrate-binding protein
MLCNSSSLVHFALVLAFGGIALPSGLLRPVVVQAVDPAALPAASPTGETANRVRIDGSGSMTVINTALQQTLSQQNPAITVTANRNGTAAGLEALRQGQVDLAAIGRNLTDAERAEGFIAIPIQREKVAMLVGTANPYSGSMTIGQFAALFRGEVTDWAKVGGTAGAVRFVDQPEASDTRAALSNYPAFKAAPFVNGPTTTRVADETAQSIASALGTDGIGYVVVSQAQNLPGTRIVTMHQTLPDDPRYPFSQSLAYVYRQGQLTPATQIWLKQLTQPAAIAALQAAAPGAQVSLPNPALTAAVAETPVVAIAGAAAPPVVTAPAAIPAPIAPVASTPVATAPDGGFPWWLLLLPIGAGLAWWALKPRGGSATIDAVAPMTPPTIATPTAIPPTVAAVPPVSGGIAPFKPQVEVESSMTPLPVVEPPVVEPPVVEPPVVEPPVVVSDATGQLNLLGLGAAVFGGAALGAAAIGRSTDNADADDVVPGQLDLPLTEAIPATTNFAPINQLPAPGQPPIAVAMEPTVTGVAPTVVAPAVVESIGTTPTAIATATGSLDATMVFDRPEMIAGVAAAGVAAVGLDKTFSVAANMSDERLVVRLDQSNVAATKYDVGQADPEVAASQFASTDIAARALADVDDTLPDLPEGYGASRMVLMARDPQWAYAYWDVPDELRQPLRDQGGQQFALRLYDVTDMPLNQQQPHSVQQYEIDELTMNWYLPLPVSDRHYTAELGYLATGGRWLSLVRSNTVRVAPIYPSAWEDDQMVSIGWNEPLQGRHFGQLQTPQLPSTEAIHEAMYQRSRPDKGAIAGSLSGSGSGFETMDALGLPDDRGQWALPTTSGQSMSGIGMMGEFNASGLNASGLNDFGQDTFGQDTFGRNMSGLNMSGRNMSGAGLFAAAPRVRQFWLVADAELIVYGATEPTATLTIGGEPIQLTEQGTFRLQMSFQDGQLRFPIMAVAEDGEQMRQVEIRCDRQTPLRRTNTREEAEPEQFD